MTDCDHHGSPYGDFCLSVRCLCRAGVNRPVVRIQEESQAGWCLLSGTVCSGNVMLFGQLALVLAAAFGAPFLYQFRRASRASGWTTIVYLSNGSLVTTLATRCKQVWLRLQEYSVCLQHGLAKIGTGSLELRLCCKCAIYLYRH
jgi:hypothetical protein